MFCVMFCVERLSCCMCVWFMLVSKVGLLLCCSMCMLMVLGICLIFFIRLFVMVMLFVRLLLSICMLIVVGCLKLRICVMMFDGWKKNLMFGKCCGSSVCSVCM